MTKQQKIGISCGAAFGVALLVLMWFLYSAYSDRSMVEDGDPESGEEGLLAAKAKNENFYSQSTKATPFPSTETIKSVVSNEMAYAKWRDDAVKVAAEGDCPPPPKSLTASAFKGELYNEVERMQKLPGGVLGRICKTSPSKRVADGFLFGFDEYLGESGTTPKESEIPQLYAQLGVIRSVVELFSTNNVIEVRKFARPAMEAPPEENSARGSSKNKPGKGKVVKNAPKRYDFQLEYSVRPAAFVKVLNELAKCKRFFVVSNISFKREGDDLRSRLTRSAESLTSKSELRPGRNRRARADADQEKVESGVVTDPESDMPILVSMTLSVYDFGTRMRQAPAASAKNAVETVKKEGN